MSETQGNPDQSKAVRRLLAPLRWIRQNTDLRHMWNAALSLLILGLVASLFGLGPQIQWPWLKNGVPEPDLSSFVPDGLRVLQRLDLDMDADGQAEVALAARRVENANLDFPPVTVMILSWDREASRWTQVFDALRYQTGSDVSFALPKDLTSDDLALEAVRRPAGAGRDLLYSGDFGGGSRRVLFVGIVRFEHERLFLAYDFFGTGHGEASVGDTGRGHDVVRITTEWHTVADPGCCPARSYEFVLEEQTIDEYANYYSIADDRTVLGALVAYNTADEAVEVVDIVPGSPADGKLQPGDVIIAPVGEARKEDDVTFGPHVFHDVAAHPPGASVLLDVIRGTRRTRMVIVSSRRDKLEDGEAGYGGIVSYGWWLETRPNGVFIDALDSRSLAASVGLRQEDRILSINGRRVNQARDVAVVLYTERTAGHRVVAVGRDGERKLVKLELDVADLNADSIGVELL